MAKEEDAGLRANVTPIPVKFKGSPMIEILAAIKAPTFHARHRAVE
jgi:hypothetical protein